jgi:hypothetical protein
MISCEQGQHSDTCPTEASPQVDAHDYIEEYNQTEISNYQSGLAHQQYLNSVCSAPPTTIVNYGPDQGPNQYNANPDCPYGTAANPYPG